MTGNVYLVGAGPGDPELLTLKALKILRTADVVLHDELVSPEILSFVPPTAQVQNVGKRAGRRSISQEEINALLVNYGLLGLQVVRLKGGDPFIFGRGGEEIEALRKANIEVEVVPGVTAALGAAAAAQIPLTHRRVSSALVFLTGHRATNDPRAWPAWVSPDTTVVIYMPGQDYETTAGGLLAAGLKGTTPAAIISRATSRDEHIHITTLEELPLAPRSPAPTLLVIGEVVRYAKQASVEADTTLSALALEEAIIPLLAQTERSVYEQRYSGDQERAE